MAFAQPPDRWWVFNASATWCIMHKVCIKWHNIWQSIKHTSNFLLRPLGLVFSLTLSLTLSHSLSHSLSLSFLFSFQTNHKAARLEPNSRHNHELLLVIKWCHQHLYPISSPVPIPSLAQVGVSDYVFELLQGHLHCCKFEVSGLKLRNIW